MYRLLVILSVLAASGAQILLKKGAMKKYYPLWKQYLNFWVIGGYMILGCSLLLNVFCMSRGVLVKDISIIESLSYLFIPILTWLVFKEGICRRKVIAIATVIIGVVIFFI